MQMRLITETSYDLEIYEDTSKKGGDNLYIVGLFSSAGIENANKRKYPRPILEREIVKFNKEKIKNKSALGQLNHPTSPETDLEKAAILIESLEWKGDSVYGKAKILSTPSGQTARSLIKDGVKLGISSRGLGTVNEEGVVDESYQLITYDLVSNPSTPGGWVNGIFEGKTFDVPGDEKKEPEPDLSEELKKQQDEYLKKIKNILEGIRYDQNR